MEEETKNYKIVFKTIFFVNPENSQISYCNKTCLHYDLLKVCKELDIKVMKSKVRSPLLHSFIKMNCTEKQYSELYKIISKRGQRIKMISPYEP